MKYVIIGNSAAGIGGAEGIRQIDKEGSIAIVSNEPHHTYSRPLISYLLYGKTTREKMKYRPDDFYKDNNIDFYNETVTKIDGKNKNIALSAGTTLPYDKLLVATGSSPFVPDFEGLDKVPDKFTFMSLDDALKLEGALSKDKRVLIVGAGLIGLKCAEGIKELVSKITVVDLAPRILSSILDEGGAKLMQGHIENKGIEFILGAGVNRFDKKIAVLEGGRKIDFDILVLAVGVRPNTALLEGICDIDKGIVADERSQTSARHIYAAGDCTKSRDISSGQDKIMAILPNAYMQGECAGVNMAGGDMTFDKAIPMNAIGFFGLHIITAGNYTGDVYAEDKNGNYKRLFYNHNRLNGYILIGDVDKAGIYTSLIREQTPLSEIDFALVCERPGLMAFTKEERRVKLGGGA